MLQISRDLSVESGPKVSEAGPGSVRVLRPNSGSDFQYRPVLDVRSVGSVPRSNPASTRPGSITASTLPISDSVRYLPLARGLARSIMVVQSILNFWGGRD